MAKPSHREKILTAGLKVMHAHGYAGASVRDVVQAAGVPQGSFTNHFASKEAFGLEVMERYFALARQVIAETLLNDALPPLGRLAAYIDAGLECLARDDMRNGCLMGNMAAEASEHSEPIRRRLVEIYGEIRAAFAYCLAAAVRTGELPAGVDCEDTAAFILASLQGATLMAKAERDPAPIERLKRVLFRSILTQPTAGSGPSGP